MLRLPFYLSVLLQIALTVLGSRTVCAQQQKVFASPEELYRQRTALALSDKESARIAACGLIVIGPSNPADLIILFQLAKDPSSAVRCAAISAVGEYPLDNDEARRFAALYESEFKGIEANQELRNDREWILPCSYLLGLHSLYYEHPIKSPRQFAAFEAGKFAEFFEILGDKWKGGEEVQQLFVSMALAVKGVAGWEKVLISFERALKTNDLEFGRAVVNGLSAHKLPKESLMAKQNYEKWIRHNSASFENLAKRNLENPDANIEIRKIVTTYLNEYVLPVARGKNPIP